MSAMAATNPRTSDSSMVSGPEPSPAMPDVHHVAVPNQIILAFEAQCPIGLSRCLRSSSEQSVPVNGLRTDEVLSEIRMNGAGGLLRARIDGDRPSSTLVLTDGKEADESE